MPDKSKSGTKNRTQFFSPRSLTLSLITIAFLTLILSWDAGGYNSYALSYDARLGLYAEKLDSLNKIRQWRERYFMRHVANYEIPQMIRARLRAGDTVLLPPMWYANRYMRTNAIWTDPRIFTWMVGFSPIVSWSDTARRSSANCYVVLDNNMIWVARRGGSTNIDSLLAEYARERQ